MLGAASGVSVSNRNPTKSDGQNDAVAEHFRRSCETLSRAAADPDLLAQIRQIAEAITAAFSTIREAVPKPLNEESLT